MIFILIVSEAAHDRNVPHKSYKIHTNQFYLLYRVLFKKTRETIYVVQHKNYVLCHHTFLHHVFDKTHVNDEKEYPFS